MMMTRLVVRGKLRIPWGASTPPGPEPEGFQQSHRLGAPSPGWGSAPLDTGPATTDPSPAHRACHATPLAVASPGTSLTHVLVPACRSPSPADAEMRAAGTRRGGHRRCAQHMRLHHVGLTQECHNRRGVLPPYRMSQGPPRRCRSSMQGRSSGLRHGSVISMRRPAGMQPQGRRHDRRHGTPRRADAGQNVFPRWSGDMDGAARCASYSPHRCTCSTGVGGALPIMERD